MKFHDFFRSFHKVIISNFMASIVRSEKKKKEFLIQLIRCFYDPSESNFFQMLRVRVKLSNDLEEVTCKQLARES